MDNILYIDLETTGLNLTTSRIIQIGLIYQGHNKTILINPIIPITNQYIHHITDEMVKDAPTFKDINQELLKYILEADIICGYNIHSYDWNILFIEYLRLGVELPNKKLLDVYWMVKLFEPSKRLSEVYLRYFGEKLDGHDAGKDIQATKRIMEYINNKLKV